jgi:AcrR family transcriptional regulator
LEAHVPRPKLDEQRREEILQAFEACVARKGLSDTTLQDVAEQAQLPRPLVRYFVGNRDAMVALLLERIVSRAQAQLLGSRHVQGKVDARNVVDFLFDVVFADDTSNAVIVELWYLARRDDDTRQHLQQIYARLTKELAAFLAKDPSIRAPKKQIESVAFSLVSLAYGECAMRNLGVSSVPPASVRDLAHGITSTLRKA